MASRKEKYERLRQEREQKEAAAAAREKRSRNLRRGLAAASAVALLALGAIFATTVGGADDTSAGSDQAQASGGKYAFAVGNPGPGEAAPRLRLPSTDGGTYDLSDRSGKTVLVYFHEGLMCRPCIDQIADIEANWSKFRALGIDEMVAVSGDELENLEQAARDTQLRTPLLSDPGVAQSSAWEANQYGMMGTSANGHSFIVVGPDGDITWRADYGGEPDYTMFVPSADLLADLKRGLSKAADS